MTIRFLISPIFCFTTAALTMLVGFSESKAIAYNNQLAVEPSREFELKNEPPQTEIAMWVARQDAPKILNSSIKPEKNNDPRHKEYIFRAPRQTTSQLQKTTYQVQVYGSSQSMLDRVKAIEPQAFLKGNLIQVGNFSTQENAEQLLKKLAIKGFWARIVILS